MHFYGLDWVGTVLGLWAIYCLGRRKRIGFVLRIAAAVAWAAFALVVGSAAGFVANVATIYLCCKGLEWWKQPEDIGVCSPDRSRPEPRSLP